MARRFPNYLFVPLLLVGCTSTHLVARSGNSVQLLLLAPNADKVQVVSSHNGFLPLSASPDARGHWLINMPAKHEFSYFYLVDGKIHLPDCQDREFDDFGGSNCLYQP